MGHTWGMTLCPNKPAWGGLSPCWGKTDWGKTEAIKRSIVCKMFNEHATSV